MGITKIQISIATDGERRTISSIRHEVYADELGQHQPNESGRLTDACDGHNLYLVARVGGRLAGFVSLTPPDGIYSIDKYLPRESLPFPISDTLYEARLLIYAAFRLIEARGGTHVMAMGRLTLKPLYQKIGLQFLGIVIRSGAVEYELMNGAIDVLRAHMGAKMPLFRRMGRGVDWDLPFPFEAATACAHGGASFTAIGDRFQTLERRHEIITADVLDAWFPPAPRVLSVLREHLSWLLQASPPADGAGLVQTIAAVRGIPPESLIVGAGSSALIYLALRHWLSSHSRVLLPDPTYGEYAHVLDQIIGCQVNRLVLSPADDYRLDLDRLQTRLRRAAERGVPYDMVVLVNPNNPTGQFLPRADLETLLAEAPPQTRFWIDEAYIEYVSAGESLERLAAHSQNIVVCKSLSKCYALSGARAAYLCGPASLTQELRRLSPPWSVSLPAQVAAVTALQEPDYYQGRYRETAALRDSLAADLVRRVSNLAVRVSPANWVLCRLPSSGPDAATVALRCRARNVFLREGASISPRLGTHTLRVAVKDAADNRRIVDAIDAALQIS